MFPPTSSDLLSSFFFFLTYYWNLSWFCFFCLESAKQALIQGRGTWTQVGAKEFLAPETLTFCSTAIIKTSKINVVFIMLHIPFCRNSNGNGLNFNRFCLSSPIAD